MHRLGFALVLATATLACDRGATTQPPVQAATPEAEPAPEPEAEAEPAPEPEAEAEPEVSKLDADAVSEGGFEARNLHCTFAEPSSRASGYIIASLVDADAALDACAPKGMAIEVGWSYVGGPTSEISVAAENSKVANCVAAAVSQHVSAGVRASCNAVLLLGDVTKASAAFEARK